MTAPSAPALFHIGNVPVHGDAILAPMDGFSDWPFRSICRELGSAMSYTEFVKAEFIVRAFEHMGPRFSYQEDERPVVFQLYGDDADELVAAAQRVRTLRPDVLDINMGCPARTVAASGAGVGMMRTPLKVARLFRRLTKTLDIPVTGKIRLGWEDFRSHTLIARIVEGEGGAAIAVHGRTKEQGYGGEADWDAIAEVQEAVKIPVIGNGDVRHPEDIKRMKTHTGCAAVMIGRAAVGNPWIFSRMERAEVPAQAVKVLVHRHLERSMAFYGEHKGLIIFRKHARQYLKLQRLPRAVRTRILLQPDPQTFLQMLDEAYDGLEQDAEST